MAHTENDRAHDDRAIKHETTDANLGGIERLVVFMAVFFAIVFVLIRFIYGQLLTREVSLDTPPPPIAQRQGERLEPMPRLQRTPAADLAQFRATEEATLGAYAWTDQAAGLAQVPIGRAIDLIAEHGMPGRAPMPAPPTSAPGEGATPAPSGSAPAAPAAPKR